MKQSTRAHRIVIACAVAGIVATAGLLLDAGAFADCGRCGSGEKGATSSTGCPEAGGGGGCCGRGQGHGHGARMQSRGDMGSHHDNIHSLLDRHEAIQREVKEIEGGVETVTTSEDPDVAKLIRRHAVRGVSEFVARGRERAHQPTPLPEGYASTE